MCSYLKIGLALVLSFGCGSHLFGQTIRTYNAQFTTNKIVADGIDSPGEWDGERAAVLAGTICASRLVMRM